MAFRSESGNKEGWSRRNLEMHSCPVTIYSWTKSAEVAYKILEGKDFEKETLISTFAIDASNVSEYSDSDWQ